MRSKSILSRFLPLLLLTAFWLGFVRNAWSYPEMIRHNYVNCAACHVSPTGGALLNPYGRSMSKEILSRWSYDGEERPFYFLNSPEWINVGGNFRAIQTFLENRQQKTARFFPMQTETQVSLHHDKWTAVGALGIEGGPRTRREQGQLGSREHYLMYQATDSIYIRSGRYLPEFGIRSPNHTLVTRQDIGLGVGQESYNLDAGYMGEKFSVVATGVAGRPDRTDLDDETGAALSAGWNVKDSIKLGVSGLRGWRQSSQRWLAGIWGLIGLSHDVYVLTEMDLQWQLPLSGIEQRGIVTQTQLGWEFTRGFHVYAQQQLSYLDFNTTLSRMDSLGPGLKIYPRPHWEIQVEYRKERRMSLFPNHYDVAWLMLHFYP